MVARRARAVRRRDQLTDFNAFAATVSPDGRWVAAFAMVGGKSLRLALIDAATGRMVKTLGDIPPGSYSHCRFSSDGKSLYYNPNSAFAAVDVATGTTKTLFHYTGSDGVARFDLAPDGTLVLAHGPYSRDAYLITGFE